MSYDVGGGEGQDIQQIMMYLSDQRMMPMQHCLDQSDSNWLWVHVLCSAEITPYCSSPSP